MVSIVIPAYREPFLNKTIESLLKNAEGEIEIIPVIDGYTLDEPLIDDFRVKPIYLGKNTGMRQAENTGIARARGEYLMKCDAHCVFGEGFDWTLSDNCEENWLLIPRRYSVKEDTWDRDEKRIVRDYHYIVFPKESDYGYSLYAAGWHERTKERKDPKYDIDDTMAFQGSCWFANRKYFIKTVGLLDGRQETYSGFGHEQIEVGLNYWLKGGEVKVIKKTWYAHLGKTKPHYLARLFSRKYKKNPNTKQSHTWATARWMNDEEPGIIHPFSWLIEKFWPIPSWTEDWQEKWRAYGL